MKYCMYVVWSSTNKFHFNKIIKRGYEPCRVYLAFPKHRHPQVASCVDGHPIKLPSEACLLLVQGRAPIAQVASVLTVVKRSNVRGEGVNEVQNPEN